MNKHLPEEWEIKKIGDILKVKHGKNQRDVEVKNGKYPILGTGGVIGRTNSFLYDKPSVLIGRKGTIDRPQFMEKPFWTVDTLFYTDIKNDIDPKWLYYKFCTIPWKRYNEATGVPSLSASTIHSIKIEIPTLIEQKKIAAVLTTWDKVIDLKQKQIEQKKEQKKGLMQKLLTGDVRFPGFKGEWKEYELGTITHISTGNKDTKDKVDIGKYPFFVRSSIVERINTYSYDGEAILIPGDGNIGKIYHYINGKFDFHQRVYKISDFDNRCIGKFVYYYLQQYFYREAMKYTAKATVDSLRLPMLSKMRVRLPEISEQKAIVRILDTADKEIALLSQELEELKQQKKGQMQLLLTGKVRVKV